jgi:hypothetical protein
MHDMTHCVFCDSPQLVPSRAWAPLPFARATKTQDTKTPCSNGAVGNTLNSRKSRKTKIEPLHEKQPVPYRERDAEPGLGKRGAHSANRATRQCSSSKAACTHAQDCATVLKKTRCPRHTAALRERVGATERSPGPDYTTTRSGCPAAFFLPRTSGLMMGSSAQLQSFYHLQYSRAYHNSSATKELV